MKKQQTNWKTIAIVFITLFVLQSLLGIFLIVIGELDYQKETECAINVCDQLNDSTSYVYDYYEHICYCYNADDEIIKQEFID